MRKTVLSLCVMVFVMVVPSAYAAGGHAAEKPDFVEQMEQFPAKEKAQGIEGIWKKISYRGEQEPFLVIASLIFLLAITHTFFAVPITKYAHKVQHDHDAMIRKKMGSMGKSATAEDMVSFKATFLHFLGEIEAIFGIWVVVLVFAIIGFYDVRTAEQYVASVNFTEPIFVVIIMTFASTRPVLRFAEKALRFFAKFGKETPAAWWLSILIVAPILGSFITEPGAMTIAAMLLAKKFFKLKPSAKFSYATIGLLFVNISVGGVLTNFAAPPILMVKGAWGLTTAEMMMHFGDKAVIGILSSTALYYVFFRKELAAMGAKLTDTDGDGKGDLKDRNVPIPHWITLTHLLFMGWTVFFAHTPPMFVGAFLFFLAFRQATEHHQDKVHLRGPILVGFFLAGLVIHGGLQGWWLAPVISSLSEWPLFLGSVLLTSFNDNAAITFLASQVDGLEPAFKYAVLAGAISGGGLTVIANAPNPAGQALLGKFFGDGVSPLKLLMGALIPTVIVSFFLMCIPDSGIHKIFKMDNETMPKVEQKAAQE